MKPRETKSEMARGVGPIPQRLATGGPRLREMEENEEGLCPAVER